MARPARSLEQHIRQGTFRSRRHRQLLEGPDLSWPLFAQMQARYRAASSEPERQAIGLECEQTLTQIHEAAALEADGQVGRSLDHAFAELGNPGSSDQLLAFFPQFLRHAKGPLHGQPFQLEGWQKAFLRELYRRDRNGRRFYKHAVLGLPHGNGKTVLGAGLAVYELLRNTDAPEVYLAAGAKAQATLGLDFARLYAANDPLATWVTDGSTLRCPSRNGTMQALSCAGALHQGRAPSAAFIDELGTFTRASQIETYNALKTGLDKRPDAYLLVTTTATAHPNSLLGRIYHEALSWDEVSYSRNGCLTVAKNRQAGTLLWWYGAPAGADPTDLKIIRGCNPASWISAKTLQHQARHAGLDEHDFRRRHLNQWTQPDRAAGKPSGRHGQPRTDALTPAEEAERELIRRDLLDVVRRCSPAHTPAAEPTSETAD